MDRLLLGLMDRIQFVLRLLEMNYGSEALNIKIAKKNKTGKNKRGKECFSGPPILIKD